MKVILLLMTFTLLSFAGSYQDAIQAYNNGDYTTALQLFKEVEKKDKKARAAYYIATMYEEGKGVTQNKENASWWYKKSARLYVENDDNANEIVSVPIQQDALTNFRPVDDNTTNIVIKEKDDGFFGFKAYKTNYFAPVSYRTNGNFDPKSENGYSYGSSPMETQFQISVQIDLLDDLFGLDEYFSFTYTQLSFWQLYATSPYFRATDYNPQVMFTLPLVNMVEGGHLNYIRAMLAHQSNGMGGFQERSWDYLAGELMFQFDNVLFALTAWWRLDDTSGLPYPNGSNNNPDLFQYYGYGMLEATYLYGEHEFDLWVRGNPSFKKGAIDLSWSYPLPIFTKDYVNIYAEVFSGYGLSLIDYNIPINNLTLGLSFSR